MTATATRPAPATPPGDAAATPGARRRMSNDTRRTLLALLASVLGAFPLSEMFTDSGWLVDVWLAMVVVVGPAALLRTRRPASAMQIWVGVVLLIPWLTVSFLREHAVLGFIPLAGTWHDLGAAFTSLHHTTANGVAPIHTTVPVRLAVCALLALVAALVDLLAVVGRHGALAGVPLLIVFTISGAVPRHPVSWTWFVLAAIGFLILLALDSSDDLQRWGHFVTRSDRSGRRRPRPGMSGQRIAVIAIVLALLVPVVIPSNSKNLLSRLFHNSGGGGPAGFGADLNGAVGTGGIDPFAALHGELNRETAVPLFNVKIASSSPDEVGTRGHAQPFYLRTNVLSTFDGDGWRPGAPGPSESLNITQFESRPGTEFTPQTVRFFAQIKITGLRSNPPVFGSPTTLSGLDPDTSWNPRQMLLMNSTVDSGQTISENVAQPAPTVRALRSAPARTDPAMADYLRLPSIRRYVRNLTARIVAKAHTPYDRARAISDFFSAPANGFSYSLQTANGDSGDDLTDFLHNRIGYCQQYAASMAVMLRLAHVPSRVVLGYAHPVPSRSGTFGVTTFDAHAWVEAYFNGIGWVPFDPTPLVGITGGTANDLAWAKHPDPAAGGNSDVSPPRRSVSSVPHEHQSAGPVAPKPQAAGGSSADWQTPVTVFAVLVLLVAILLVPAMVRWRRRRRRLARVRHGDTDALWAELADTTVDLGYVWSDARTPRQVARWLGSAADSASGSLQTVTSAVERARYSPAVGGGEDLAADLEAVRAGLGERRSPRERMRARFWPASLNWSRMPVLGRCLPGDRNAPRRH